MFAHKLRVNQGFVQLNITASQDTNVSVVNVMDGLSAVRTDFVTSGMDDASSQIYTGVKPNGVDVTAYLYAAMECSELDAATLAIVTDRLYIGTNDSSIAQAGTVALSAGNMTTINKYVGGASSDGFINPQAAAKYASLDAMNMGFYQSMLDHIAEWAEILPEDSVARTSLRLSIALAKYRNRTLTRTRTGRSLTMSSLLNPLSRLFSMSTTCYRTQSERTHWHLLTVLPLIPTVFLWAVWPATPTPALYFGMQRYGCSQDWRLQ